METAGVTLLVLGAASLVAAVAGGLKFWEMEFPLLASRVLRIILALVGSFFFLVGFGLLAMAWVGPIPTPPAPASTSAMMGPADSSDAPDSPTAAPDPTPTPEPTPTSEPASDPMADYQEAANAACTRVSQSTPAFTEDHGWYSQASQLWAGLAQELHTLSPPVDTGTAHTSLVDHFQWASRAAANAGQALYVGDPNAYQTAVGEIYYVGSQIDVYAASLSLPECSWTGY